MQRYRGVLEERIYSELAQAYVSTPRLQSGVPMFSLQLCVQRLDKTYHLWLYTSPSSVLDASHCFGNW